MASSITSAPVKKICSTCRKHGDVFTCRGCRKAFCTKHLDEHRAKLSKEINSLADKLDRLRSELDQENEAQNLLSTVHQWEQDSIAKICLAAETIRTEIQTWIDRNNIEIKIPFDRIVNELRACQQTDDYTEIDLKRWTQHLEEYRSKIEKLPTLKTTHDNDTETIRLIKIKDNNNELDSYSIDHSTPMLDKTLISMEESSTPLVREKFDSVVGSASIIEDGVVATYSGAWLGESSVYGINVYSSGTHHIRFRVLEKFYDAPFFGIITASQQHVQQILETVSANGWSNLDFPIINGEKNTRAGRDKLLQRNDDITLILDCDRKQLFLKHHRTKRLFHLPIDVRACPFPWKIIVVLYRRGDAVRIVGGTISLTRDNIVSRLSEHRKM